MAICRITVARSLSSMQALFVHGMGRSPLSGWPMLRHIKKAGIRTRCFGYSVSLQSFYEIQVRLIRWIEEIAAKGWLDWPGNRLEFGSSQL
ncbi:MAG: hypothetical protein ACKOXD_04350, partial [Acinetobacter sp.]